MKDISFSFFLGLSLLIHVLSLGLLALTSQNFFTKHRVIPSSIKVDVVGLPEKELPKKPVPAVAPPAPKVKKSSPPKKPKPPLEKKSPPKQKTVQKPQIKEKPSQDTPQETEELTKEDDVIKGNKVSKGTDREGEEREMQLEQLQAYIADVKTQIKLNWNLPKHLKIRYLYAQVEVKINEQGEFIEKGIVTSSENELFDRLVLEAIEKSSPVLPPPSSIRDLIEDGIVFGLNSHD